MRTNEFTIRAPEGQHLNRDALRRIAPSIFATKPSKRVSERYAFIPTIEVVESLVKSGLVPVAISVRRDRERESAKHVLRFRLKKHDAKLLKVGDSVPEVQLINAHNAGSPYLLAAGLFRLVCSNGMVAFSANAGYLRVRHIGKGTAERVIEESKKVIEMFPAVAKEITGMQHTELSPAQQRAFAREALALRWNPEMRHERTEESNKSPAELAAQLKKAGAVDAPITPDALLLPKRTADQGNDLWRVFNRVQENLVRGGMDGVAATGRRMHIRALTSVDADLRVNSGLWALAASKIAS